MSYTNEQTEAMKAAYLAALENGTEDQVIKGLAANLGKSEASIIAKLSSEKVYVAKARTSKVTGDKPKTKAAYVKDICEALALPALDGLDKAPKQTLIALLEALE